MAVQTEGRWLPIPDGWVVSPFVGTLPAALFRYRPLSDDWVARRFTFELEEESIFLAGAHTLNDPDEGRVQWKAQGSFEAAVKLVSETLMKRHGGANPVDLLPTVWEMAREMTSSRRIPEGTIDLLHSIFSKSVRIACFTTRPVNGPMWTHYGNYSSGKDWPNPHGGICIEYAVDESWRTTGLRPVEYAERRPEVNMLSPHDLEEQFAYATRVKSPDWAYEDEWRIVAYMSTTAHTSADFNANSKLKLEGCVKSVIFGLNAESAAAAQLATKLRTQMPHVALKKVVRHDENGTLMLAPLEKQ